MSIIIAEAGANHRGDRELMGKMVEEAAKAGANVIKFQSWRADRLKKTWPDYEDAYQYYKQHELSEEDHRFLLDKCKQENIEFLTTVFDLETVDFLAGLGLERVKLASSDATSWRLIDKALVNFEHVIISTGMHTNREIKQLARHIGNRADRVTVMHCVSLYPLPPERVNMLRYRWIMDYFPSVGYSDHTEGTDAAKLAIAFGASAVEKHFTLDRTLPGKDQRFSIEPAELAEIARWNRLVQTMMFDPEHPSDLDARRYIGKWGDNA